MFGFKRNTGLDYIGRSSGVGALNIWTHNLKDIRLMSRYKILKYDDPALKVSAAVQGFEMLEAASHNGVTILAGICKVSQ